MKQKLVRISENFKKLHGDGLQRASDPAKDIGLFFGLGVGDYKLRIKEG